MKTKNNAFSTLLTVLITAVVVGVLTGVITYSSVASKKDLEIEDLKEQLSQTKREGVDEMGDWKTYTNDKYGFSFKYPQTFELASASEAGDFIPFNPLIISSIYIMQSDSKKVIFSVNVRENEMLTPTWIAMQSDALKPATLQPSPVPVIVDSVSGYKIAKGTISITTDSPQGTKYVSDQYFLQKTGGPILNLVIPGDSGDQILSTFQFTK